MTAAEKPPYTSLDALKYLARDVIETIEWTLDSLAGDGVDDLKSLAAGDIELLDALDQALRNQHGGDRSKAGNAPVAPEKGTRAQALRKLRDDAPELHADVLAGRLSAHAAMVTAGFRPKTFTVRADDPVSIARTLRKQLAPDVLTALRAALSAE